MRRKRIDRKLCMGCKNCELACIAVHSDGQKPIAAYIAGAEDVERARNKVESAPDGSRFPQFCRHCDDPACVEACMSGALTKGADGLVVCDHDICVGCYMCVMSCPYGMARPSVRAGGGHMIKCDGCRDRASMACIDACPQHAITMVEAEAGAPGGHLVFADGEVHP